MISHKNNRQVESRPVPSKENKMPTEYDVVIIGSGLGGLVCGALLAREGWSVCLLEKNKQIGGTLQTFARDKVVCDSGIHYVGGLDDGQNLNQFFKFLGIMSKLKLKKLDENVVDAISFEGDDKVYKLAQGYENFIRMLLTDFPEEEIAIRNYCDKIKEVCAHFPLYNLQFQEDYVSSPSLEMDVKKTIEGITSNKKLQQVLAGNNLLYIAIPDQTPFYVHALVINSYIQSAYRFVDGGAPVAKHLSHEITSRGSVVKKHSHVHQLVEVNGLIQYAELQDGTRYYGKKFISNLHPKKTIELTKTNLFKKAYLSRISKLENSTSTFIVSVVLKKNTFPYLNYNYYHFADDDVYASWNHTSETWPKGYALFCTYSSKTTDFADGVTLMTFMHFNEMKQWEHTQNTVGIPKSRGADYDQFKKEKAEKLFDSVEKQFPGFRNCISTFYCATPLTLRDYVGNDDGSIYGVLKDYKEPLRTFISPQTKIPNLLLTGQNLNLHGMLGVTVTAIVTCSKLLGMEYLLKKIKNA